MKSRKEKINSNRKTSDFLDKKEGLVEKEESAREKSLDVNIDMVAGQNNKMSQKKSKEKHHLVNPPLTTKSPQNLKRKPLAQPVTSSSGPNKNTVSKKDLSELVVDQGQKLPAKSKLEKRVYLHDAPEVDSPEGIGMEIQGKGLEREENDFSYGPIDFEEDFYSPDETGEDLPVPVSPHSERNEYLPVLLPTETDDPLTHYLREINKYELLSPEQERALTQALVETGDIEVAKKLVLANLRLVVKIAMEYRYAYNNVMDLIQEGNIGLMKAVSKYNPEKGAKLSYYASWWIRSYILKFILDNFRLVKIGTTSEQKKLFYNLLKEKERLLSRGIEPEVKLLSENLGVSEKSINIMDMRLSSQGQEFSIDRPQFENGRATTIAESLPGNDIPLEDQIADAQDLDILKKHLKEFVASLKDRDRVIFKRRLLSEVPPSLQALADEYGVSRERIRQIEERLIKKLKVYMSEFLR